MEVAGILAHRRGWVPSQNLNGRLRALTASGLKWPTGRRALPTTLKMHAVCDGCATEQNRSIIIPRTKPEARPRMWCHCFSAHLPSMWPIPKTLSQSEEGSMRLRTPSDPWGAIIWVPIPFHVPSYKEQQTARLVFNPGVDSGTYLHSVSTMSRQS